MNWEGLANEFYWACGLVETTMAQVQELDLTNVEDAKRSTLHLLEQYLSASECFAYDRAELEACVNAGFVGVCGTEVTIQTIPLILFLSHRRYEGKGNA